MDFGISPIDSLMLINYEEIDFFIGELKKKKEKEDAKKSLQFVTDFRIAYFTVKTKKGDAFFSKWSLDKLDIINGKNEVKEVVKVKPKKSWSEVFKSLSRKKKPFIDVVRGKHGI